MNSSRGLSVNQPLHSSKRPKNKSLYTPPLRALYALP